MQPNNVFGGCRKADGMEGVARQDGRGGRKKSARAADARTRDQPVWRDTADMRATSRTLAVTSGGTGPGLHGKPGHAPELSQVSRDHGQAMQQARGREP